MLATPTAPAWAHPLSFAQYQRLLATIAEELDFTRLAGDRIPDQNGILQLRIRDNPDFNFNADLGNLARQVAHLDETEWAALVRHRFSIVYEAATAITAPIAPEQLRVVIRANDASALVEDPTLIKSVCRPLSGNLSEFIVVDYDNLLANFTDDMYERLDLPKDEIWRLAEANTKALEYHLNIMKSSPSSPRLFTIRTEHEYGSTAALWLDAILEEPTPYGALVVIADRSLVFGHVIDSPDCAPVIASLAMMARTVTQDEPYVVSTDVFWSNHRQLHLIGLKYDTANKRLDIAIPPTMIKALKLTEPSSLAL